MEVIFSSNLIECFDLKSNKVVFSRSFSEKIASVRKVTFNSFLIYNQRKKIINSVVIDLASERNRVATGAQYIRDMYMDAPTHGYYFGTYEIGEFSLNEREELVIERSYALNYCSKGCVSTNNMFYFGLRESPTSSGSHSYYLVKLDWNRKEEPLILWKKSIPSSIMGIFRIENRLYFGLKTGTVQIWDTDKDEILKSIKPFNNPISTMELGLDSVITTSWNGETALISLDGDIQWRIKLTNEKIETIFSDIDKIMIVDIKGNYFQLNSKTGNIIEKGIWTLEYVKGATIASNLIIFRDWYVLAGYGGVWAFWNENYSKIFHYYMEDPLIRKLYPHPLGFYTGDDTGYIRFWKLGGIRSSYTV